jgi:2-oxo-4-hydroxy-4-carboxy-5-ureidoimidazoline decarboxylase
MELWQRIDEASAAEARALLQRACGAERWVGEMVMRRPFGSVDALIRVAAEVWWSLSSEDWQEAFTHHPKIGDVTTLKARFPATHDLSAREQASMADASDQLLTALAAANRTYEARFGFIFIVCATGKSPSEMLALLDARLRNDYGEELRIAADEQFKITALRLRAA